MHRSSSLSKWRRCVGFAGAACVAFATAPAHAHFILQAPPSWMSQDASGVPEKLGPCGNEGGGTATGTVTAFQPGQTITVTIDEVVFHPGHYRVALSVNSRSELPAEPTVMATSSTPCGSVPIQSSPVFPVLADGVLQHTSAFAGAQSFQVTLPSNVTCAKCTLQVIEFMSNHPLNNPGGCFYHHCADISMQSGSAGGSSGTGGAVATGGIKGAGGTNGNGGSTSLNGSGGAMPTGGQPTIGDNDAGEITGPNSPIGSCSCSILRSSGKLPIGALSLGALGMLLRSRARNRRYSSLMK